MKYFVILLVLVGFAGIVVAEHGEPHPELTTKDDVLRLMQDGRIIPPLNQVNLGVKPDQVRCNEHLVLVIKYDGSPACVKEHSIIPLMIRGWAEISEFEITSGFLKHEIKNGKITSLKLANDCAPFLIVTIDSQDSGELTISIPRKILDPKIGEFADTFFVLVDGEEVDFEELNSNQFERTLKIPFGKDSKSIEIIQTCLI